MGVVVDSNVLSYATGEDHPLREPCRALVEAVMDSRIEATTTVEVIQEFACVRARRRTRSDAALRARQYAVLLGPLLLVESDDLLAGLDIWNRQDDLGSFDAVLAAATIRTGATLVSADKAFSRVRGLAHVVPDVRGMRRLLR